MIPKIAITGLGAICAAGNDLAAAARSFTAGVRAPAAPTLFKTELPYPVFEVKNFQHSRRKMRTFYLALKAAQEALAQAGMSADLRGKRIGIALGTTVACQLNDIDFYRSYKESHSTHMEQVDRYLQGNISESIKRYFNVRGPALTVANACSSATDAIGIALDWLRCGVCDMALCGGADELSHVPYCGFGALSVTSSEPCRPFDKNRRGLNLGEGAGIIFIEKEPQARERGARVLGNLLAYAACADAYHLTAPNPQGAYLERAIYRVLSDSGVDKNQIAFINAHGTSTRDNDRAEGQAFKNVFGENIRFLSTKGFTGHTLGAAGGLEAVFTCYGLEQGWLPASIGFNEIDPEIGLAPLREKTSIAGGYALSTSLAFGGNNSVILLGAPQ